MPLCRGKTAIELTFSFVYAIVLTLNDYRIGALKLNIDWCICLLPCWTMSSLQNLLRNDFAVVIAVCIIDVIKRLANVTLKHGDRVIELSVELCASTVDVLIKYRRMVPYQWWTDSLWKAEMAMYEALTTPPTDCDFGARFVAFVLQCPCGILYGSKLLESVFGGYFFWKEYVTIRDCPENKTNLESRWVERAIKNIDDAIALMIAFTDYELKLSECQWSVISEGLSKHWSSCYDEFVGDLNVTMRLSVQFARRCPYRNIVDKYLARQLIAYTPSKYCLYDYHAGSANRKHIFENLWPLFLDIVCKYEWDFQCRFWSKLDDINLDVSQLTIDRVKNHARLMMNHPVLHNSKEFAEKYLCTILSIDPKLTHRFSSEVLGQVVNRDMVAKFPALIDVCHNMSFFLDIALEMILDLDPLVELMRYDVYWNMIEKYTPGEEVVARGPACIRRYTRYLWFTDKYAMQCMTRYPHTMILFRNSYFPDRQQIPMYVPFEVAFDCDERNVPVFYKKYLRNRPELVRQALLAGAEPRHVGNCYSGENFERHNNIDRLMLELIDKMQRGVIPRPCVLRKAHLVVDHVPRPGWLGTVPRDVMVMIMQCVWECSLM